MGMGAVKKEVTEEWIEEWAEILGDDSPDATKDFSEIEDLLKQMLAEIGVEVVKTASNARDAYGGDREDV
ncbi:unnamed protein product [marine sediment metagenome]|uniref:Uncharacterized protein n=1 Tax=marine sediment metagenome TaxID=412755 RepID=X0XT99_9ZZZZ